jgi:hypothetical protein
MVGDDLALPSQRLPVSRQVAKTYGKYLPHSHHPLKNHILCIF